MQSNILNFIDMFLVFYLFFFSFALHSYTVCCMNCGVRGLPETEIY